MGTPERRTRTSSVSWADGLETPAMNTIPEVSDLSPKQEYRENHPLTRFRASLWRGMAPVARELQALLRLKRVSMPVIQNSVDLNAPVGRRPNRASYTHLEGRSRTRSVGHL